MSPTDTTEKTSVTCFHINLAHALKKVYAQKFLYNGFKIAVFSLRMH